MNFVDTHAHMYLPAFQQENGLQVSRCLKAQVNKVVLPNVDMESMIEMKVSCKAFPDFYFPTVGLHPCDVRPDYKEVLEDLSGLGFSEGFFGKEGVAIGETGLDYYWDITFKKEQQAALEIQIDWAIERQLPLILHTRNSMSDAIAIVKNQKVNGMKVIFHCFGGNVDEAKEIIAMDGFYLGIGGTVTYKNSTLPEILKEIPLDKIVLETDAPYLPPVPYRGKQNESSYIPIIAEKLAYIYRCDLAEIAAITTQNAKMIFGWE